jgi:hypothetical protein
MRRRLLLLPVAAMVLSILGGLAGPGPAAAGSKEELTFQVSDARAYGYKVSIPQPVIQVAPKCDPKSDPYKCDGYDHRKNCPPKVDIGATALPPDPASPQNADGITGGAGDNAGNSPTGTGVPQSSAVRLNQLLSLGALGRVDRVLTANGLASYTYTELATPPWDNEGHTETDAFTNANNYEERCYPTKQDAEGGTDYAHFFSHSLEAPGTDHFSECFETQCQLSAGPLQPTAEHGVTQVHLELDGGVVCGVMSALLENLEFPGGFPLTIHELRSYASFETDGTSSGLKWNVISVAQGAEFAGQPINLPQGQSIEFGAGDQAFSFGMAGPYVSTAKDGSDLRIVAPGFFVATSQQTAFMAGVEMTGTFGRSTPPTFHLPGGGGDHTQGDTSGGGSSGGGTGSTGSTGTGTGTGTTVFPTGPTGTGTDTSGSGGGTLPPTQPEFAIISKLDAPWAPIAIIGMGALAFLLILGRWVQQFEWGRRMYETRPLRSFQWLYRAFVKT